MQKILLKTKYFNGEAFLEWGKYTNNNIALKIINDNEILYVATVNLPEHIDMNKKNTVLLKGWSENEGLPEALEKSGVLKLTGRKFKTGFVYADEAILLMKP